MRAFTLVDFDSPARVTDVPLPAPAAGEILIRVGASSVNPVDNLIMGGFFRQMLPYRLPAVLGRDVAGTVERVGADVERFAPGDRVWGFIKRDYIGDGTFAEYVTCPADYFVAPVPDGVSTAAAGVLGVAGVTAQECLDVVDLAAGDTVLINGATGGTGTFAVQLARARGARVIGTARPGAQAELVASLGADAVLDWTGDEPAAAVRDAAPRGVDAIVDLARPRSTGDARSEESSRGAAFADFVRAVAAPQARIASITNSVDAELLTGFRAANVHSSPTPEALGRLADLVAAGTVTPVVTSTFKLDELDRALAGLAHSLTGKTAVQVASD